MSDQSAKLAEYVSSLADFTVFQVIDEPYRHMGATIADAILQANNKYQSNVVPRVERILREYPDARTTSATALIVESISATVFLNWAGKDRAVRFSQVVALFKLEGVETEQELSAWLGNPANCANCAKLDAVYGIGPKTVDYFKILCGQSASAIDRHLLSFLELAGIETRNYQEAQDTINGAADLRGIGRECFDHSIWQFMSKRTGGCAA